MIIILLWIVFLALFGISIGEASSNNFLEAIYYGISSLIIMSVILEDRISKLIKK